METAGEVVDAVTGEILPGANIFVEVNGINGFSFVPVTSTDLKGSFKFSNQGRIKITYIGYEDNIQEPATFHRIKMIEASNKIAAVTVTGKKTPKKTFPVKNLIIIGVIALAAFVIYKKKLFFW